MGSAVEGEERSTSHSCQFCHRAATITGLYTRCKTSVVIVHSCLKLAISTTTEKLPKLQGNIEKHKKDDKEVVCYLWSSQERVVSPVDCLQQEHQSPLSGRSEHQATSTPHVVIAIRQPGPEGCYVTRLFVGGGSV